MKSHKLIGLIGMILCTTLIFVEIGYQEVFSKVILIIILITTAFLGILCWNYTVTKNWKAAVVPALKITVVVTVFSLILGVLMRFIK